MELLTAFRWEVNVLARDSAYFFHRIIPSGKRVEDHVVVKGHGYEWTEKCIVRAWQHA